MEISNEVDKRTIQTATDNVLFEIKALLVDKFKKILWKFKLKSSDGYFDVYELATIETKSLIPFIISNLFRVKISQKNKIRTVS
jgi:hypothetical protein